MSAGCQGCGDLQEFIFGQIAAEEKCAFGSGAMFAGPAERFGDRGVGQQGVVADQQNEPQQGKQHPGCVLAHSVYLMKQMEVGWRESRARQGKKRASASVAQVWAYYCANAAKE